MKKRKDNIEVPELYFQWGFKEMFFIYKIPITFVDNADGKWFETGEKEIVIPINLN